MSHLTWNSVLQELSHLSSTQLDHFALGYPEEGTEGLEDEQQLGCRCVTVALCDKQQQTHILGSSFSALSGLVPRLSFTFSLFSPSLPEFYSFSLTLIQPYSSPESHLTSPWETTLFLKQGFGLMAVITDLLWKFIWHRTEQALCECILNKEVTPTPILPPIKKEKERSTELEGMRIHP